MSDALSPDSGQDGAVDGGTDTSPPIDSGLDAPVVDGGGDDAGSDAGSDAGTDAPIDAPIDVPVDMGTDTGPGCVPATCNNGDACDGVETCVGDVCTPGTAMDCSDGVPCTIDGCTASTCSNMPDDTMCVGGLSCDAVRGCIDPTCVETPCRTVAPQCGCGAGEGCYLGPGAALVCAPAGTVPEGGDCSATVCTPGTECINASATAVPVPLCKRYCNTDADCVGPGSLCIVTLTGTAETVCTNDCNVVTQVGCPGSASCGLFTETGTGRVLTDCGGPVGTGGQGAACIDDTNCQRGFTCIDTGPGGDQCLKWCRRVPSVPADCGAVGGSCTRVGPTGLVFNGTEYGVCFM